MNYIILLQQSKLSKTLIIDPQPVEGLDQIFVNLKWDQINIPYNYKTKAIISYSNSDVTLIKN